LRWRNQDRIALHRLSGSSHWRESGGNYCGENGFGSGLQHIHPPGEQLGPDILLLFVAESKLFAELNNQGACGGAISCGNPANIQHLSLR